MRQSNLKQSIKNTIVSSRREKRLTPREEQETVAQFLARGGQITPCDPLELQSSIKYVGDGRDYQ